MVQKSKKRPAAVTQPPSAQELGRELALAAKAKLGSPDFSDILGNCPFKDKDPQTYAQTIGSFVVQIGLTL